MIATLHTLAPRGRQARIKTETIVATLRAAKHPLTSLEVAAALKAGNVQHISSRLSHLADYGVVARDKRREWIGTNFVTYCLWSAHA